MKTIAFCNNKGGGGKTTLSANVAYNLSAAGSRVLMVDCDPQGNLSSFFGRYDLTKCDLYDALSRTNARRCVYRSGYRNLDMIPGNIKSEELTPDEEQMEALLQQYETKYDYCIIDCAPAFSKLTEAAVQAADVVLIPIKLDNFSIEGIDTTLSKITNAQEIHVVINQFTASRAGKEFLAKLMQQYEPVVCETVIRHSVMVDLANYMKKPMARKSRFHRVTNDLKELTEEVCRYGVTV